MHGLIIVTSAARAAAARRLCPVWHFEVNGISDPLATAWGRRILAKAGLWCDHAFPRTLVPDPMADVVHLEGDPPIEELPHGDPGEAMELILPPVMAPAFLAPWRSHSKLT